MASTPDPRKPNKEACQMMVVGRSYAVGTSQRLFSTLLFKLYPHEDAQRPLHREPGLSPGLQTT